jgi:hypothetical protein
LTSIATDSRALATCNTVVEVVCHSSVDSLVRMQTSVSLGVHTQVICCGVHCMFVIACVHIVCMNVSVQLLLVSTLQLCKLLLVVNYCCRMRYTSVTKLLGATAQQRRAVRKQPAATLVSAHDMVFDTWQSCSSSSPMPARVSFLPAACSRQWYIVQLVAVP